MALLAAYNFDETSGDVVDHSGNGRNWTLNTGAQRTTGDGGHTDEGLTKLGAGLATVATPAFGQTSARTFMLWVKGTGNAVWWLRWYITGADTGSWGLYNLSGNVTLRLRKGGSNTNITTPMPGDGLWHHYAGTYDGTNSRLYLDGTLVATSGTVTAPLDSADSIQVLETSLTTQTMDDLRIYDEALDQSTIAALMSTPVGSAPSASGTVTLSATAGLGVAGVKTAAGTVTLSGTAGAAASGQRASAGAVSLPATAALAGSGGKATAGAATLTSAAGLQAGGVRTSIGAAGLSAGTSLAVAGASTRSGSVTLAATARITTDAPVELLLPPSRTFVVAAEPRVFEVPAETRTWEV